MRQGLACWGWRFSRYAGRKRNSAAVSKRINLSAAFGASGNTAVERSLICMLDINPVFNFRKAAPLLICSRKASRQEQKGRPSRVETLSPLGTRKVPDAHVQVIASLRSISQKSARTPITDCAAALNADGGGAAGAKAVASNSIATSKNPAPLPFLAKKSASMSAFTL